MNKKIGPAMKDLGYSSGTPTNWKNRNKIPVEACYKCWLKTGYKIEWLLTGEGKPTGDSPDIDKDSFIENYWKTIDAAVLGRLIKPVDPDYKDGIDRLALSLYEMSVNSVDASEEATKKAK